MPRVGADGLPRRTPGSAGSVGSAQARKRLAARLGHSPHPVACGIIAHNDATTRLLDAVHAHGEAEGVLWVERHKGRTAGDGDDLAGRGTPGQGGMLEAWLDRSSISGLGYSHMKGKGVQSECVYTKTCLTESGRSMSFLAPGVRSDGSGSAGP
jgi:hypothetical protein